MRRTSSLALLLAAVVGAVLAVGLSRGASAADPAPGHRVVYLFVSGKGPQAKAWYDGGPPQGAQVQAVLDLFAKDGFRFSAISSSGVSSRVAVSTQTQATAESALEAEYVILLER